MALVWLDRTLETTTTTGTGALTLAAAVTGYQRFSAGCSTNDTVYYTVFAVASNGNPSGDWETGLGTYSAANQLTRTTVSKSSNSNNAVNFAAGTKWVMACPIAAFFALPFMTGALLTDPNADRIAFWDDSAGAMAWLQLGTNLSITGTTLDAAGGGSGSITASGYTQNTARMLGRTTASSGAIEEITVGTGLSLSGGSLVATGGGTGTVDAVTEYTSTSPSAPATGLTIFDRKRASAHHLSARSPIDISEYQKTFFGRTIMMRKANPFSGSTAFGCSATDSGTNGATPGTGSYAAQLHRFLCQTSSSAGNQAYLSYTAYAFRGNAAGLGGFFTVIRFVVETANAGFRWFVGMQPQVTGFGNVDPSSRTNIFGVGKDAADSNVQLMTNDGSGTATKTDLGASFPAATAGAVYELRVFCEPNASAVYYSLERLDSAQFTEGSASSDLPSSTQVLGPMVWANNGAVASSAQMGMMVMYTELPY